MPNFPYINNEVKCAFRWYRADAGLRNRNLRRCGAEDNACPWAINSPNLAFPPFQFKAGSGATLGLSTPTSWKVYDLDGNELLDLASDLDKLQVVEFSNPSMEYIVYTGDTLSQALPSGEYVESVITCTGTGLTFYSETVKVMCLSAGTGAFENTDFGDGTDNWEYGSWSGLIVDVETVAGDPSYGSPQTGDKVINTGDNNLYVWNGSAWVDTPYSLNTFYSESVIGGDWWTNTGGGWIVASPPYPLSIDALPDQIACWNGTGDVALSYFPQGVTGPAIVNLSFNFFYGGGITGEMNIYWNGDLIATFDNSNNGEQQDVQITYTGADPNELQFVPSGGFQACMTTFTGIAQTDSGCRYVLEYWNCGDLGTQYYSGGFKNRIYLSNDVLLYQPTPQLQTEEDTLSDGSRVDVFSRKEVDYKLSIGGVPWWFLDAVTEIPLHSDVTITDVGTDVLSNVTIEAPWGADRCKTTDCIIGFNVDDATVNDTCCIAFDPPCLAPCVEASGFNDAEDPVVGQYYLDTESNQYQEYIGTDPGPVDGWGELTPCESGIASGINGFNDYYWDSEAGEWVRLAELTFHYDDYSCGTLSIEGVSHPRYFVRLQWSADEITWENFDPDLTLDSETLESGTTLNTNNVTTPGTMFIRLEVFFGDCIIGYSNVCPVFCQSMIEQTLEDALSGWSYIGGSFWTTVAAEADLAGIPGPTAGDLAMTSTSPVNQFYYYDGSNWVDVNLYDPASPPPPILNTIYPNRLCILSQVDAIQGTLSSPVDTSTTYQLQITITGDLYGVFYFPSTFVYLTFSGAGTYTADITPVAITSQFYVDFNSMLSTTGCITQIAIRPLCDS